MLKENADKMSIKVIKYKKIIKYGEKKLGQHSQV